MTMPNLPGIPVDAFDDFRMVWAKTYDFQPGQLNSFGYSLLRERKTEGAIRVFRLNVALYSKDANAYDSLGEAYMEAGRTELAIANCRKSLELDPKNDNAVTMLKKLGADPKP